MKRACLTYTNKYDYNKYKKELEKIFELKKDRVLYSNLLLDAFDQTAQEYAVIGMHSPEDRKAIEDNYNKAKNDMKKIIEES